MFFDEEVRELIEAVYRRLTSLNNQFNNSSNILSQDSIEDNYQLNNIFDQMQTQGGLEQIILQHRQFTNSDEELDKLSIINNSSLDNSYLQNNFEEHVPYYDVPQIERYLSTCMQGGASDQSFDSNFNNSSFSSRNLNDVSQSTSFHTNFSDIQLNSSNIDHSYNDLLQITDFVTTDQPKLQLEFDISNSSDDVVIIHANNNSFAQENSSFYEVNSSFEIQSGQKISNPNFNTIDNQRYNDTIDNRAFDVDVLDLEVNLLEAAEASNNISPLNLSLFDSVNEDVEEIMQWYRDRKRRISEVDEPNEIENSSEDESEDSLNQEGGARFFSIEERQSRENLHFGSRQVAFRLNFHNLPSDLNHLNNILLDAINNLRNSIRSMHPNDFVQFFMMHDNLDNPIVSPVVRWNQLTAEYILNLIDETVQSNKSLAINTNMFMYLTIIKSISGGSGRLLNYIKNRKKTFSNLQNTDKMCLLRAIILGKYYVDYNYFKKINGPKSTEYLMSLNDYKNFNQNEFRLSIEVANLASKLNINDRECGISDVIAIEKYLKDYQISVLRGDNYDWEYEGEKKERRINLIHIEIPEINMRHFELIKSLPAVFNKRHYCYDCKKAYQTFSDHKCNKVCFCCKDKNCSKIKYKRKKCDKCQLVCNGEECYLRHLETRCGQIVFCEKCNCVKSKIHVCFDERWCSNCNKAVLMEHSCCILTQKERDNRNKNKKNNIKFKGFIFFDYECMNENGVHIPNLVVADKVCIKCLEGWKSLMYNEKSKECQESDCGVQSFKTNESFCLWLLKQDYYICIAHNLRAYDSVFILNYLVNNPLPNDKYDLIMDGLKVNLIKFNNIKIIDSLNFIPSSLSKFPKTFGLKELKKGYFPHKFNTPDNQFYNSSPYPAVEFYGSEYMNEKDRNEFLKWYELNKDKQFNFQEELLSYCESDVNILKLGCLSFRESYFELLKNYNQDIDPFRDCCTLASLCQRTFRTLFMKPNSIALINQTGFNPTNQYSKKQIEWLQYISLRDKINIRHALNGGEVKIGSFKVDGYCEDTRTIYEFHGCWFHGCLTCFQRTTLNPLKKQTMQQLFDKTKSKETILKKEKFNYIEIWEHEWDEFCKSYPQFLLKDQELLYIKPRDALFGGRTNAAQLYYKCDNEEKIKYYDFTSLYPFVQKNHRFPKGVPQILNQNLESDIENYFGLIKCSVLPPQNLLFPVLPIKCNKKLVFPLCVKCAEFNLSKCDHSDNERVFTGTWVSEELKVALAEGYKIMKIHCVWHWEEGDDSIFSDYVNTFLKAKQENSGFPSWCENEENKKEYINLYKLNEDIELDLSKITFNEGKRTISKLMLNSLWGRYAMQTNKPKTVSVNNKLDLMRYLHNELFIIKDLIFYDYVCHISYIDKEEIHQGGIDANIALGCFVTAYGRIKLYSELKKLGSNVLYYDTDSIIFVVKGVSYEPELGDYLGDLTSELDQDDYIEEFVSAGPKNYGYRTKKGKEVVKVKGFSLSSIASEKINYKSVLDLVKNKKKDTIKVQQLKFKRNKVDWSMRTEDVFKNYKQVYDKRILLDNLSSLPFGYKC